MVRQLENGVNYCQWIASYQSNGLKILALLTIPNAKAPKDGFPVIEDNHGYIPPEQYRTTEKYLAYQAGFAKNGYIIRDLRDHGLDSRYSKHLFDTVHELKDRTSEGGARVYFIHGKNNQHFIVHAECKKETQARAWMLGHCLEILEALEQQTPVFPKGQHPKQFLTRKEQP